MNVLDGCGLVAEGGAVSRGLLKRSIYSNRTVSSPVSDAVSHNTRFTAAPTTFTTPELPACNIAKKNFMKIIGNDKSIRKIRIMGKFFG